MRQFHVTEAHIGIVNIALKELNLAQQDVKIMNRKRNNHIIKNPTGNTTVQPGDKVLVYGDIKNIRKFFILSGGIQTRDTMKNKIRGLIVYEKRVV